MTVGLPPVADANVVTGVKVWLTANDESGKLVPSNALATWALVQVARTSNAAAIRSTATLGEDDVDESIFVSRKGARLGGMGRTILLCPALSNDAAKTLEKGPS